MGQLLNQVHYVVGVDTHKDSHTAATVDTNGGARGHLKVPTDAFGNRRLLDFARENGPVGACGRSRALAASARDSRRSWWSKADGLWR